MRLARTWSVVLLTLVSASCSDRSVPPPAVGGSDSRPSSSSAKAERDESVLSGNDLEAVELAVGIYVRQSAMNPVEVPKRIETLSAKYAKTRFNASTKGCMSVPDGTTTFGEISFTLTGNREIAMTFTNGAIGFHGDDIWVRDGTELRMNDKKYTYQRGKWRVVK
jgi:hypothetical protein